MNKTLFLLLALAIFCFIIPQIAAQTGEETPSIVEEEAEINEEQSGSENNGQNEVEPDSTTNTPHTTLPIDGNVEIDIDSVLGGEVLSTSGVVALSILATYIVL